jgi:hypothetical protein
MPDIKIGVLLNPPISKTGKQSCNPYNNKSTFSADICFTKIKNNEK